MTNQNPEQVARDHIDKQLLACGWLIQDKSKINLGAGTGIAVREYQTHMGIVVNKMEGSISQSLLRAETLRQSILKRALREVGLNLLILKKGYYE